MNMREYLMDFMEEAIFLDGFDDAIIGHGERCGLLVVLYDVYKCIDILMADGMTDEEAQEYFDFNILNAYLGENTPLYCYIETD